MLALGCAACEPEPEIERGPIDYAAINEAAEGPAIPLALQPIALADIEQHELSRAGCRLLGEDGVEVLVAANEQGAHLMLDEELTALAPHSEASQVHPGVVSEFDGRTHSLEIAIERGSTRRPGPGLVAHKGTVMIRDAKGRIVFDRTGTVECGS